MTLQKSTVIEELTIMLNSEGWHLLLFFVMALIGYAMVCFKVDYGREVAASGTSLMVYVLKSTIVPKQPPQ